MADSKTHASHDGAVHRDSSESPHLDEKEGLRTVDAGLSANEVLAEVDPKEESRILRKIDFRLIPLLAVLYLSVTDTVFLTWLTVADWPTSTDLTLVMQRLRAWKRTSI